MRRRAFLTGMAAGAAARGGGWSAGVARAKITPPGPAWMSGYGNRPGPSEGVHDELWTKALALSDGAGARVLLVTADVIALSKKVTGGVAARLAAKHGIGRECIVFNASHTHTGPAIDGNLPYEFDRTEEQERQIREYGRWLSDRIEEAAERALAAMTPCAATFGRGAASLGVFRREPAPQGIRIGVNRQGPVDRDVPVLSIEDGRGKPLAIVFGHACHNTTPGALRAISADYAGFAQAEIERARPGATALFLQLCGADQNPEPKGSIEVSAGHGKTLAAEVLRVVESRPRSVEGPLRAAMAVSRLPFAPHTRESFEAELQAGDRFGARRARAMLKIYDQGRTPPRHLDYAVQRIGFGGSLRLVALPGEVCVEYGLRIKERLGKDSTVVAGYSNDVPCYIPTDGILKEGAYEGADSMKKYGQPAPFAPGVERLILGNRLLQARS